MLFMHISGPSNGAVIYAHIWTLDTAMLFLHISGPSMVLSCSCTVLEFSMCKSLGGDWGIYEDIRVQWKWLFMNQTLCTINNTTCTSTQKLNPTIITPVVSSCVPTTAILFVNYTSKNLHRRDMDWVSQWVHSKGHSSGHQKGPPMRQMMLN